MQADLQRMAAAWREQSDASIERMTDTIVARVGGTYAATPREQLMAATNQLTQAWQAALDGGDSTPIRVFAEQIGRRRSADHIAMNDILRVVDIVREQVWDALERAYADGDWNIEVVALIERWLHEMRSSVMGSYGETLLAAEQRLAEREQALAAQNQIIQELSTPIVPIHAGVLVLPLVGTIDSRRATQIMESVLEQIVAQQAEVIIIDITGVPVVDTGVANYIMQMMRAIKLLGATSVLVGIGNEIAQTLVQLGIDLSSIAIRANLRDGITYALERGGMAIQPVGHR